LYVRCFCGARVWKGCAGRPANDRIACCDSSRLRERVIGIERQAHLHDSEEEGQDSSGRDCCLHNGLTILAANPGATTAYSGHYCSTLAVA
jgi:hypothetical protein